MRRVRTTLLIACAVTALGTLSENAFAGFVSDWQASFGLFPDEISPPYTLVDDASPEDPALSGGILTLTTDSNAERMFYGHVGAVVDTSGAFFIETSVRFVSGVSSASSRAPIMISFTTAPNVGNALLIDQDRILFLAGDSTPGPSAVRDTDGDFHTYRIEYDGAGGLELFYDDVLVTELAAAATFMGASHGPEQRILWGEVSILARGTSEWEFFRHNALAVPEPAALALIGIALAGLGFGRRRK